MKHFRNQNAIEFKCYTQHDKDCIRNSSSECKKNSNKSLHINWADTDDITTMTTNKTIEIFSIGKAKKKKYTNK